MKKECLFGEDEEKCDYQSDDCGTDMVDIGSKCWSFPQKAKSWNDAYDKCGEQGR